MSCSTWGKWDRMKERTEGTQPQVSASGRIESDWGLESAIR